eukprot:886955-Pelagomonas_calceolata.AAC.2
MLLMSTWMHLLVSNVMCASNPLIIVPIQKGIAQPWYELVISSFPPTFWLWPLEGKELAEHTSSSETASIQKVQWQVAVVAAAAAAAAAAAVSVGEVDNTALAVASAA